MAPSPTRSSAETIEVLRLKLQGYIETAAEAVEDAPKRTRNALAFIRYLLQVRKRLRHAVEVVYDAPVSVHEDLLRQAEISYLTNPGRFSHVTSRLELLEAWDTLLLEASEKIAVDQRRALRFASGTDAWSDTSPVAAASRRQAS